MTHLDEAEVPEQRSRDRWGSFSGMYFNKGYAQGMVDAEVGRCKAESMSIALLRILEDRGLEVSRQVRERIMDCSRFYRLEKWLIRAAIVDTAEELFE